MQALPVASSIIILVFAALVFRRYRRRRGRHLLIWGLGLLLFGMASLAEAYAAAAWSPLVFRLWYLGGAVLSAAWIGQGTVSLLSPQRLATALTGLLLAASLVAAYFMFAVPLDASRFDPARPLSAQYRQILPAGATVRRLTPAFNIYGTLTLVGGALYSAWLLRRKEMASRRVLGNVLIALGAFVIAGAGTMVRLGLADYLYVGELLAAALMFAGFLLATARGTAVGVSREAVPA